MLKFLKNLKFKKAKKGLSLLLVVGFSSFFIFCPSLFSGLKILIKKFNSSMPHKIPGLLQMITAVEMSLLLNRILDVISAPPPPRSFISESLKYSLSCLTYSLFFKLKPPDWTWLLITSFCHFLFISALRRNTFYELKPKILAAFRGYGCQSCQ